MAAPVDDVKRRRELAAAEGFYEICRECSILFDRGPKGFTGVEVGQQVEQRRRATPMEAFNEPLAPEPRDDFSLGLRLEAIKGYLCVVSFCA